MTPTLSEAVPVNVKRPLERMGEPEIAIEGAVLSVLVAGMTSRVMLCGGKTSERELLLMAASGRWVIALAAVSCQTCAFPLAPKLLTCTVEGVVPVSVLETIMMVSA